MARQFDESDNLIYDLVDEITNLVTVKVNGGAGNEVIAAEKRLRWAVADVLNALIKKSD